ncbi:hypothetical protein ACFE04_018166 [Oxalis oulophora]
MAMLASTLPEQGNWDNINNKAATSNNVPVSCMCFQQIDNPHCSLVSDVFPILVEEEEAPPLATASNLVEDVYSFSVLPENGHHNPKRTPQLTFLSFLKVPLPSKKNMCLDAELDCQDCIDFQIQENDPYSSCIMDIDLENANSEKLKCVEDTAAVINTESVLTHFHKVLQRQTSFKTGEKILQILMNHGLMLLKLTARDKSLAEKVHEVPNNRMRRCKRVTWFDSRKIVLMFSIL